DLHTDIKKITDKFFAPGPIANFLDAFVKGEGALPITSGSIHGLPRAWRRGFGKPPETRPSLLFMDLPDPSTPDSASRNHAVGSILDMVKENNRHHIPVFGVSGCGKTRAVINADDDDWRSGDMMTLYDTVRDYLKEIQAGSAAVDLEVNNLFARKATLAYASPAAMRRLTAHDGLSYRRVRMFSSTTCSTLYSSNSSIFDIIMCLTFSPLSATCTRMQGMALLSVGVYQKSKMTPGS
ncbi:hypothetical protein BGZ65_012208, partial [Modicella reniformis]